MKLGTTLILVVIAFGAAALLSSGCADPWVIEGDFGIGEFTGCSYDTIYGWSDSVESDGYVSTIKGILVDAKDKIILYYNTI